MHIFFSVIECCLASLLHALVHALLDVKALLSVNAETSFPSIEGRLKGVRLLGWLGLLPLQVQVLFNFSDPPALFVVDCVQSVQNRGLFNDVARDLLHPLAKLGKFF